LPKIKTSKLIYKPTRGGFGSNLDIFKKSEDSIPVRMIYNEDILTLQDKGSEIEEAFIHMHGGGWMLFTSFIT
jgi:acetyl esterase/lipase